MKMVLEDMSGSLHAYAWQEEIYRNEPVKDLSCLYVEGQVRRRSDETVADLLSLDKTDKTSDAVRFIPHSVCPQPWLMSVLEAAVSRFTILPLKQFVESIFADDSIAFAFVSAPASLNHHHNYPGGLLAHSLECYQLVEKHHEFSRSQRELGLAAALLHDVGKVLTLTHDMKRTSLGHNMSHDKLTLEI
jgi:3'-5' exoribonuclease